MFLRMVSRWQLWRLENKYGIVPQRGDSIASRVLHVCGKLDDRFMQLCGDVARFVDSIDLDMTTAMQIQVIRTITAVANNRIITNNAVHQLGDIIADMQHEALKASRIEEHAGLDCRACELSGDLETLMTLRQRLCPESRQHRSALRPAP